MRHLFNRDFGPLHMVARGSVLHVILPKPPKSLQSEVARPVMFDPPPLSHFSSQAIFDRFLTAGRPSRSEWAAKAGRVIATRSRQSIRIAREKDM
jgi:hypothetical protein